MIYQQTEPELEELHREAAACCEFLAKALMRFGCPKDDAHKILCRFVGLYQKLGIDPARMERMIP